VISIPRMSIKLSLLFLLFAIFTASITRLVASTEVDCNIPNTGVDADPACEALFNVVEIPEQSISNFAKISKAQSLDPTSYTCTQQSPTFNISLPGEYNFTVPKDLLSLNATLIGGGGGYALVSDPNYPSFVGVGAIISVSIDTQNFKEGSFVYINVAGKGHNADLSFVWPNTVAGGFNGGGNGGKCPPKTSLTSTQR